MGQKSFLEQFDPISLLRDIVENLWMIILCTISAVLFTYVVVSFRYEPAYTSRTIFVVTDKSDSIDVYSNLKSAQETAARFKEVLDGTLLRKAIQEDLEMESFDADMQVTTVGSTNMVEISVTANSNESAFKIMKSLLKNYRTVTDYIIGEVELEIIESPVLAENPSNRLNTRKPMRTVGVLVFLLLCALEGAFSVSRNTVKNPEQFKSKIDSKSLGVIYHENMNTTGKMGRLNIMFSGIQDLLFGRILKPQRPKVSMLIDNPMRSYFYVESNRMMANRVRNRMDRRNAKVALVTSVMENEGKSTVTANLALGLAEDGKNVLLIDADLRKPSQFKVFQLGEEQQVNLAQYLEDMNISEKPAKRYKDTSLYLIANNKKIREDKSSIRVDQLRMIIEYYRREMDYILIDTAPMALVTDTEHLATLADGAIMVIREDVVLAEHINDAIDSLNKTGCHVLGCIFNNATRRVAGAGFEGDGKYGGYYGR